MSKIAVILGSSRSDGNTYKACKFLIDHNPIDLIDLRTLNFSYFDYKHENKGDDFLPTLRKLVHYDTILFASPIYWYSMSGIMKVFLDRLTDILTIEKDIGRTLRGKSLAVLSCSDDDEPAPTFYAPFELTAGYLGMKYNGGIHAYVEEEKLPDLVQQRLLTFHKSL